MPFKDNGVKETIVRDIAYYCASRENSLNYDVVVAIVVREVGISGKWPRSLEAHRRRDIIQSLYLLVFQRSHSRFNSRYVYCHSVVIFPLKFSLDNKKLRRTELRPPLENTVARRSIALNKFVL